jgi:hypothetical protein
MLLYWTVVMLCGLVGRTNILEKYTASIFRADCHENLKSHTIFIFGHVMIEWLALLLCILEVAG